MSAEESSNEPRMHSRVNTGRVQPDQIDELVAATRPILPRARQEAPDLKSVLMLGDRRTGKLRDARWAHDCKRFRSSSASPYA